uniref:Flavin-containing monooxygenase n=1 Tax=Tetradesmus obliquus TaxID=3088 RepID=A0A383W441_TETOB|eukprot:jgi/Sobl393_1/18238/SZX71943.1
MAAAAAPAAGQELSVAIVGAGFSGLCMAIQLKRAGIQDFTIFEAADAVGGTWRDNTFPGCACDIPSVLYCFSFEPYPFTRHYSGQPEILRYQQHCVTKYGLAPHIRLSTRVTAAAFDAGSGTWAVTTAAGDTVTARVLVLARGGLAVPSVPSFPGMDTFPGAAFHTARWDHSVELTDKRVAVVGTGASAIQIVPAIQPHVASLTLFQRTPPWVMPRKARLPGWAAPAEGCSSWYNKVQRRRWFLGMELLLGGALTRNKQGILKRVEKVGLAHLQEQVPDHQLRAALAPSYSVGCKRILASDEYYPALCQPNVQVVTSAVKEVHGIVIIAEDGTEAEVDVIIYATGFDLTATHHGIDITAPAAGAGVAAAAAGSHAQQTLNFADVMGDKPRAFYGLGVAGFPNLFMINGPNTGLGHNSMIYMAECGVKFIVKLLRRMRRQRLKSIQVTAAAQQQFNKELQARLRSSVWLAGGCGSWYVDRDGEGSSVLWPGLCLEYWWRTCVAGPRAGDWAGAKLDKPVPAAPGASAAAAAAAAVTADVRRKESWGSERSDKKLL